MNPVCLVQPVSDPRTTRSPFIFDDLLYSTRRRPVRRARLVTQIMEVVCGQVTRSRGHYLKYHQLIVLTFIVFNSLLLP